MSTTLFCGAAAGRPSVGFAEDFPYRVWCNSYGYSIYKTDFLCIASAYAPVAAGAWYMDVLGQTLRNYDQLSPPYTSADVGGTYGALRFDVVADPLDAAKKAFLFRVNKNDTDTGGATKKRLEISFEMNASSKFVYGVERVIGMRFLQVDDLSATTDDQLILQIHGGAGVPQSPYLEFRMTGNTLRPLVRYDVNGYANPTLVQLQTAQITPMQWYDLIVECRPALDSSGYVRIYLGNALIASYSGPMGYDTSARGGELGHLKCGHYHWMDTQGWDDVLQTRAWLVKACVSANLDRLSRSELLGALSRL